MSYRLHCWLLRQWVRYAVRSGTILAREGAIIVLTLLVLSRAAKDNPFREGVGIFAGLAFRGDWTGILLCVRLLLSEQTNNRVMHAFMREMGAHDEAKRVPSDYELEEVFSRLAKEHELHLPLSENLPKAGTRKSASSWALGASPACGVLHPLQR